MKIYLAGPMSGYPQFNFPAFYEAAETLRRLGFDVVSPAEMDALTSAEIVSAAMKSIDGSLDNNGKVAGHTWGDLLSRDVKMIADGGIEGIMFLQDWQRSKGARLEATVGLLKGNFAFFQYADQMYTPIPAKTVAYSIYQAVV